VTRLVSIDALRGIAILLVMASHLPFTWSSAPARIEEAATALAPLVQAASGYGSFGVHLFLVVSGFCIHMRWARRGDLGSDVDFFAFWRRRLTRLYPPYFVTVLLSIAGLFVLFGLLGRQDAFPAAVGYSSASQFFVDLGAHVAMIQNANGASPRIANAALWTLALEEQLYLMYFGLLALRRRLGWGRTMAIVLGVALAWRAMPLAIEGMPATWNDLAPARWPEWALGALAAERYVGLVRLPRVAMSWWTAVAFLVAAVATNWPGSGGPARVLLGDLLFGLAFFVAANAIVAREPSVGRRRGLTRVLASVGLFSYSLYLTHQPVMMAVKQVVLRLGLGEGPVELWLMLVLRGAAALFVGYVFYRIAELPAIRASRRIGRDMVAPLAAATT